LLILWLDKIVVREARRSIVYFLYARLNEFK